MIKCKKCKKEFPTTTRINGVRRNISNRTHCLECIPFNEGRQRKKSVEEIRTRKALEVKKYYEKERKRLGKDPGKVRREERKRFIDELSINAI